MTDWKPTDEQVENVAAKMVAFFNGPGSVNPVTVAINMKKARTEIQKAHYIFPYVIEGLCVKND